MFNVWHFLSRFARQGVHDPSLPCICTHTYYTRSEFTLDLRLTPLHHADIVSNDRNTRFNAVQQIRKLLSKEQAPPAKEVIDAGLVPILVKYLLATGDTKLQFEAAWALTNISSTEYTHVVVDHNAVLPLVQLLKSPDADVREQCVWCLGNVAGDGAKLRNLVLSTPASCQNLLLNIAHPSNISMLRNATWTMSNLCRGKPQAELEHVAPFLPALAKLIKNTDNEVASDACWALSYISDGANARIDAVARAGVVPQLIELLGHQSVKIVTPALRTIGNVASGNDAQTQLIVDGGIVQKASLLLRNVKRGIRKETCWTLSNIAAGNSRQIAVLTSSDDVLKQVINATEHDEWDVRKEAAWVISNVCTGGNAQHVKKLVDLGALKSLVSLLEVSDTTVIGVALDAIHAVLTKASPDWEYDLLLDELEGVEKIENLQSHKDEGIYNKSVKIIDDFFSGEDDENEDENIAPKTNENTFAFGVADSKNVFQLDNSVTQFGF